MAPVITRPASGTSLQGQQSLEEIPLGEYLFLRIAEANPKLRTIFGIPGDFNLNLLEHLYNDSISNKFNYVGLCNELNAGYTVDGYSKVIGGLTVLVTTFGVGELSAINAIAGAFAEYAPILHIVGTTSTKQVEYSKTSSHASVKNHHHLVQNKNPLLAPNHDIYKPLVEPFSCIQESLTAEGIANGENFHKIDKVLSTIIQESRPGYIFIPSDIPDMMVPMSRLNLPFLAKEPVDSMEGVALLSRLTDKILDKLYQSKRPAVMGDALVIRFQQQKKFDEFINKLPSNYVRLFTTNMGRNIDETLPNFVGTYYGALSPSFELKNDLELQTDVLINFGYNNVETNTAGYSWDLSHINDYVEIHPDYILIDKEYIQIKNYISGKRLFPFGDLIQSLSDNIDSSKFVNNDKLVNNITYNFQPKQWFDKSTANLDKFIPQTKLIDFFNSYLRPNDILIVETCTFLFAIPDIKFPKGVQFFSQNFYGSIGYALPATLGASIAEKDLGTNRRIVLVQGDGSAQMTVQELSSYLRYDLVCPKIFLLNNEGYTVERIIKGPTRPYNDIQETWKWCDFFKIFGDPKGEKHTSVKLHNVEDLDQYFNKDNESKDKIEFIELLLDKLDSPERFQYISGSKPMPSTNNKKLGSYISVSS